MKFNPNAIKLVKNFHISWDKCEFGAPCVDPKRPFGNSDVYGDMAEILGIEPDENEEFTREQENYMDIVYESTKEVLQYLCENVDALLNK